MALRRTGSLWFFIGAHFAFDYCNVFVYSLPMAGLIAQGHLLNASFHGPYWLTGGTVGPTGSVFFLVVLALTALTVHFAFPKRAGVPT
jgi:membrane protease YdiL (CAAX protease family)